MAAPLGGDDVPNYLQEGAAAAVKAAESLSRGLSQNVQWGIGAAAGHMNIPHRKRGVLRAADTTKASSKAARDSTASKPTPPRGTATPGPPLAGVGRPKPSPNRSPPPSPPAAAAPAAAESPGTRSNLRQSGSSVSSDAGPSLSPGEYQSPSSAAHATASAQVPTKQQVVTTPYYTLTAPLLPSCCPFTVPLYHLTAPLLPPHFTLTIPVPLLPHPYHTLTTPLPSLTTPHHTLTKVVLLVGWTPMIGSLLRALDARMPPGSTLFVLSERKEKARAQETQP